MNAILAIYQLNRSVLVEIFVGDRAVKVNALDCGAAHHKIELSRLPCGDQNIPWQERFLTNNHLERVAEEVHLVFIEQKVLPQQQSLVKQLHGRWEIRVRNEEIARKAGRKVLSKPVNVLIDEIDS